MKIQWEVVAEGLERIKIEGGYLYRSFYIKGAWNIRSAPVFVKTKKKRKKASRLMARDPQGWLG